MPRLLLGKVWTLDKDKLRLSFAKLRIGFDWCLFLISPLSGVTDRHWNPYHLHCNLCHTEFDIILKLETLEQEEEELFRQMNIRHLMSSQWRNR